MASVCAMDHRWALPPTGLTKGSSQRRLRVRPGERTTAPIINNIRVLSKIRTRPLVPASRIQRSMGRRTGLASLCFERQQ